MSALNQAISSQNPELFSVPYFLHALSGTMAGVIAISSLFPLDTARTRLQVDELRPSRFSLMVVKDLVKEEGLQTLYRGWRSLVLSTSVTNFVYFYVFHGMKLCLESQSIFSDLIFGTVAGVMAVLVSNPFWVVNTRLKLQGLNLPTVRCSKEQFCYKGIWDCFLQIARNDGLISYFDGLESSILLVSNPCINFVIYECLKRNTLHLLEVYISASFLYFVYGGLAKLLATVITYPMQMVQTRARAGISISSLRQKTKSNWENLCFFYRGLESKIFQTVLTSALMLMIYEHIKSLLFYFVGHIYLHRL